MPRVLIGILSLLLTSFLFAVPASAFVLDSCAVTPANNEFVLIGQDNIVFEGGDAAAGKTIEGSVLVTSLTGFAKLGKNIHITGDLIAHTIILHSSFTDKIDGTCVADSFESPAGTPASAALVASACPNGTALFATYAANHASCVGALTTSNICGPTPTVNNCVAGQPTLTVAAGATLDLAPGCYGPLVLKNGAVLNLLNNGTFTFPSVHMNSGSQLNGPGTVNVNGVFETDSGVFITSINLNIAFSTTAEVLKIFNNSILTDVVVNAPLGKCHLHTGTDLAACSEVCCKVQDVEPITAECNITKGVCVCPENSTFANSTSRECVCNDGLHFENNVCVP